MGYLIHNNNKHSVVPISQNKMLGQKEELFDRQMTADKVHNDHIMYIK